MANIKVNDLISSEIELLSSEEIMEIEASIRELSEEELNISGGGGYKKGDDDDDGGKKDDDDDGGKKDDDGD